jgi:hypothetical protein
VTCASRFLIGQVTCFATHDGISAVARAVWPPIGVGRHTDQLGEASAEGAQRRAADRETDLGDAEVTTTRQRHRALDVDLARFLWALEREEEALEILRSASSVITTPFGRDGLPNYNVWSPVADMDARS